MESTTVNLLFDALNNSKKNAALLMTTSGVILKTNGAFLNHFSYTPGQIVGKNARILFTEKDQIAGKPEEEIEEVLATGRSGDNNDLVCGNGKTVWVSGESVKFPCEENLYILKIIQDIHKHKEQQLLCLQLKNFNENILATIDDAVIVLNQEKKIIKHNSNYALMYHEIEPIIEYERLLSLIEKESVRRELNTKIERALTKQKSFRNFEIEVLTPQKKKRVFEITGKPLREESGDIDVLVVLHDVTLIREIQSDREDVLGLVAHELRNPMANLKLCNDILNNVLREENLENALRILEKSENNIHRLNTLVEDLYDATKIYGSNSNLTITSFDAKDMIKEAIETIEAQYPDFEIKTTDAANITLTGDRFKLIQVITNYLSNAIKYSGNSKTVYISVTLKDGAFQLSVRDNGVGIPEEQLPYLFTRFFRSDKTSSLKGLGLGLYLCKLIIESHHGLVWAQSEEGKGSVFYFQIPIK